MIKRVSNSISAKKEVGECRPNGGPALPVEWL
jgi:hypothetical protein